MVARSLCTILWKSPDPRLRVFVTFCSPIQAAAAIQAGQVQIQTRMLSISCLSATDSSILRNLQSAQMPPMLKQFLTPVTPTTHDPPSAFPIMPSSNHRLSSIPYPTTFSESVLTIPRCHRLTVLQSQTPFVFPSPNPAYELPAQGSASSPSILDPSKCVTKRLQQELDEIKQKYAQIQEEKNDLDRKNTELLAQYNQAIADRSRVDHELLSVRSENNSLSKEKKGLQRKLRDVCQKKKDLEHHQKERDKKWHTRCESIKGEWQTANTSLKAELNDLIRQRDESMQGLQICEDRLKAVLGALEQEEAKRAEQEIEIQALRSREVVEPEISKALRAIEGLAYKGTVKLGRPRSGHYQAYGR